MKTFMSLLTIVGALALSACGSKSGSTSSNSVNPYNTYNSLGTTGIATGAPVSAVGIVRDLALQADVALTMVPVQTISSGVYPNSGTLQVTGEMVIGASSTACPINPGTYTVTGQAQYSLSSFSGVLQMVGPISTQVYFNSYLTAVNITSLYVGSAPYAIQNQMQISGCVVSDSFQSI